MTVPGNTCEFIVYAEPHGLTMSVIRLSSPSRLGTTSLRLSLDPDAWREGEINLFILEEVMQLLEATEAEIVKLNAPP
jgi:hypothetical protein